MVACVCVLLYIFRSKTSHFWRENMKMVSNIGMLEGEPCHAIVQSVGGRWLELLRSRSTAEL